MGDTSGIAVSGADLDQLAVMWTTGVDHGGNPVESFVDDEGGWPLRCCLRDSRAGESIAIVAWSPFPWRGAFAEIGPIVVHADQCDGPGDEAVPSQFLSRRQVVRPYGVDRRIAYDHVVAVEGDGSLPDVLADVLARDGVEFVQVRNVAAGCWSFNARRR